ncbi:hypothetical protein ACFQU2_10580 [Siccirubricoccus deserti]
MRAAEVPGLALFSAMAGLGQAPARAASEATPPSLAEVLAMGPQHAASRESAPREALPRDIDHAPAEAARPAVRVAVAEPTTTHAAPPPPMAEVVKTAAPPVWTAPAWLPPVEILPHPLADRPAPQQAEAPALAMVTEVTEEAPHHRWSAPTPVERPARVEVVRQGEPAADAAQPADPRRCPG